MSLFHAVPVVSFTESLFTGSETVDPVITLTRTGDVNVVISVVVRIVNIPHPGALRELGYCRQYCTSLL